MRKKRLRYISLLLFFTFVINLCVPCLSVQEEAMALPGTSAPAASFPDVAGHWAEKGITAWTVRELAGGYPDGTFRPDSPITRAEFVTLVNRAFGYSNMADLAALDDLADGQTGSLGTFRDVTETDWYAVEFAQAVMVGYLGGYPDGTVKPQNPITRQEVAAVITRILPSDVEANGNGYDNNVSFTDEAQISEWSQAAIATAVSGGYMSGYPDGTFQPTKPITRAEAISVLDRAVGTLYNHTGTYGPIQGTATLEGNVTITTPGVTLQNTIITGNLYLTEGLGEGDVTLNNVTVQGTLFANAPVRVQGQGTIENIQANVDGVVIEVPVKNVLLADGVQATVNGKTITENYQYTEPQKNKSKDLTLSDLTINGTTISGFAVDTLSYEVVLPYGTTEAEIPTVAATAHHAKARVEVTQATSLTAPDNIATVLVTAENGRTQTYTVTFTVALNPETSLSVFEIGGYDVLNLPGVTGGAGATLHVPNFSGMQGITVETAVPNVQAVTVTVNSTVVAEGELATKTIQPHDVIVVTIVAADGESTAQYKVTVEYGPIDDYSCTVDDGTSATMSIRERQITIRLLYRMISQEDILRLVKS